MAQLSLALTASPNPVTEGQTSVFTLTRSNGELVQGSQGFHNDSVGFSSHLEESRQINVNFQEDIQVSLDLRIEGDPQGAQVYVINNEGDTLYSDFLGPGNTNSRTISFLAYSYANGLIYGVNPDSFSTDNGSQIFFENWSIPAFVNEATDAIAVSLSSNDTNIATVPSSVTILANNLSRTFNATALNDGTATITATRGSASDSEILTVLSNSNTYNEVGSGGGRLGGTSVSSIFSSNIRVDQIALEVFDADLISPHAPVIRVDQIALEVMTANISINIYDEVGSGGVGLSGTSINGILAKNYNENSSGGIGLSGTSINSILPRNYNESSSGGVELSGQSLNDLITTEIFVPQIISC